MAEVGGSSPPSPLFFFYFFRFVFFELLFHLFQMHRERGRRERMSQCTQKCMLFLSFETWRDDASSLCIRSWKRFPQPKKETQKHCGLSSVGRASALQAEGQDFDYPSLQIQFFFCLFFCFFCVFCLFVFYCLFCLFFFLSFFFLFCLFVCFTSRLNDSLGKNVSLIQGVGGVWMYTLLKRVWGYSLNQGHLDVK